MWKALPVLGSRAAAGIRAQITDGEDGRLVGDPENPDEIATLLGEMLTQPKARDRWGRNARRRVAEALLIFAEARRWLEIFERIAHGPPQEPHSERGRFA
jgi:trehalose synthase